MLRFLLKMLSLVLEMRRFIVKMLVFLVKMYWSLSIQQPLCSCCYFWNFQNLWRHSAALSIHLYREMLCGICKKTGSDSQFQWFKQRTFHLVHLHLIRCRPFSKLHDIYCRRFQSIFVFVLWNGKAPKLEFNHAVRVSKECPLKVLKQRIAKQLGLEMTAFRLRKSSRGDELRDLEQTLKAANIRDGGLVFVEYGVPTGPKGEESSVIRFVCVWSRFWRIFEILRDSVRF